MREENAVTIARLLALWATSCAQHVLGSSTRWSELQSESDAGLMARLDAMQSLPDVVDEAAERTGFSGLVYGPRRRDRALSGLWMPTGLMGSATPSRPIEPGGARGN